MLFSVDGLQDFYFCVVIYLMIFCLEVFVDFMDKMFYFWFEDYLVNEKVQKVIDVGKELLFELVVCFKNLLIFDVVSIKEMFYVYVEEKGLKMGKVMFFICVVVVGMMESFDLLEMFEVLGCECVLVWVEKVVC